MNKSSTLKYLLISTAAIALIVGGFLVYALAGLSADPVAYTQPPSFVEDYVAELDRSGSLVDLKKAESNGVKASVSDADSSDIDKAKFEEWMKGFSYEERLAFKAVMTGETLDQFYHLVSHPEKEKRVKVASAYAAMHVKYSHHEESGFGEKRNRFNDNLNEHLENFRNALSEGLIASAKEGTRTRIPYTLAWLPGQGRETVELFEWAAKHHPHPRVRRACMYFVAKLSKDDVLVDSLLSGKVNDPDYKVRKLALNLRYRKFIGDL